jgi:DNA-binding HxlR family transcriptional regulator
LQSIEGHKYGLSNGHKDDILVPQISFIKCPIKTSLGVLGKKWTILILRDIGFRKISRFNRLLESIPGLTPRVLSMRLRELEKEGLIECKQEKNISTTIILWNLTEKGKDTLPILLMISAFSFKWYSEFIFEDKKPRKLNDVFPQPQARKMILNYLKDE